MHYALCTISSAAFTISALLHLAQTGDMDGAILRAIPALMLQILREVKQ
jgi:hypothetical protein